MALTTVLTQVLVRCILKLPAHAQWHAALAALQVLQVQGS